MSKYATFYATFWENMRHFCDIWGSLCDTFATFTRGKMLATNVASPLVICDKKPLYMRFYIKRIKMIYLRGF